MADAWGGSFGDAWGVSWTGGVVPPTPPSPITGGGAFPMPIWEKKKKKKDRRKENSELMLLLAIDDLFF